VLSIVATLVVIAYDNGYDLYEVYGKYEVEHITTTTEYLEDTHRYPEGYNEYLYYEGDGYIPYGI